ILSEVAGLNSHVFFLSGGFVEDITLVSQLFSIFEYGPNVAVHGANVDQLTNDLLSSANYWLTIAQFHPDMGYGQPSRYMGTTADWVSYHDEKFGNDAAQHSRRAAGS